MTPPTAAQEALTAVRRATAARRQAESEWRASLRHAASAGCTMRQIAEETDVTHTRVFQLVNGRDRGLT